LAGITNVNADDTGLFYKLAIRMHGQEEGQVIIHTETKTGHNRQNSPRGFSFPLLAFVIPFLLRIFAY
jgi:hypothetical protein